MAEERENTKKAVSDYINTENFLENINKLYAKKITSRHFIVQMQKSQRKRGKSLNGSQRKYDIITLKYQ